MQYNRLGLYIRKCRTELGVSLNSFCLDNDIDSAILSRIETLKQGIKMNVLEKISNGFNKTPAQFLAEFEEYQKNNSITE